MIDTAKDEVVRWLTRLRVSSGITAAATATPMFDCFTDEPDYRPFLAVSNRVPLDELNPEPRKIADPLLRKNAVISARLNFSRIDACPEDVLNRILWHAVKGPHVPYPSWAISLTPDDD